MECPKCRGENTKVTEQGTVGLAWCPDCGYSRAHAVSGLYLGMLYDWCSYRGIQRPDSQPKNPEELAECQRKLSPR